MVNMAEHVYYIADSLHTIAIGSRRVRFYY